MPADQSFTRSCCDIATELKDLINKDEYNCCKVARSVLFIICKSCIVVHYLGISHARSCDGIPMNVTLKIALISYSVDL